MKINVQQTCSTDRACACFPSKLNDGLLVWLMKWWECLISWTKVPLLYEFPKNSPDVAIWKWKLSVLLRMDGIFALATCVELVVACPCALASVMNIAWAQGKATLLVLRVFRVEAFTISPLCHHLNYLSASLIHTSAASVWSGRLRCKLHTFWNTIN